MHAYSTSPLSESTTPFFHEHRIGNRKFFLTAVDMLSLDNRTIPSKIIPESHLISNQSDDRLRLGWEDIEISIVFRAKGAANGDGRSCVGYIRGWEG